MAGVGPPRKRARTDDIEDPFSFEEELASFHSLERSGSAMCPSRWCRPDPPQLSSAQDEITFQQIDIDHYIGDPVEGMPGARNGPVPIVRMYGVTMEGNSVCAHIHGFLPYFYVPAPSESFANVDCDRLRHLLNDAVLSDMRSNKDGISQAIYAVELCRKCSMLGFHFNRLFPFLKITVATPKLVPSTRRVLNNISMPQYGSMSCPSFESNVDFEVRFMVDTGIVGCNWIKCSPGLYILHSGCLLIKIVSLPLLACFFGTCILSGSFIGHTQWRIQGGCSSTPLSLRGMQLVLTCLSLYQ